MILKLKTSDFKTITRSLTPPTVPESEKELHSVVQELIKRVDLSALTRFRLVGVGLSNFLENEPDFLQPQLFAARQSEYSIDN